MHWLRIPAPPPGDTFRARWSSFFLPLLPILLLPFSGCTLHFDKFSADIYFDSLVQWPDPTPQEQVYVFVSKSPQRSSDRLVAPDNTVLVEVNGVRFERQNEDGWFGNDDFELDTEDPAYHLLIGATNSGTGSFNGFRDILHWETVALPDSVPSSFQIGFNRGLNSGAHLSLELVSDQEDSLLTSYGEMVSNYDSLLVSMENLPVGMTLYWRLQWEIISESSMLEAADLGTVTPIYRRTLLGSSVVVEPSEAGEEQ
ncbi:hypothetical protein KQI63_16050 [bacterium]|nr:hypothetical protein [bacterium]